ncbi:ABC transporter ATP-binding protein [Paracoccus xiamenensis]|uniref:ABC transporter ATP-binding protein n=1 Tax=Paracoccus xiamenensis TaxID=2714901 RepID=UPI001407CDB7|nr:sn-glycerol-3-phosphate ABC transporter ATP-binding protein UgpC [Paracoccus xiamenensis]NHF72354.1 sn-glycerol-3-phosphate ABC transporter ATP-binding protein UgpC [Paracoccus xiamenensis]
MANVKIDNVVKRYGAVQVMHGVNVDIEHGEFVVLVGPSGCGKSTLLRMLAGLEEISDGTISIGDKVVNGVSPKDRDISMVFQSYALYPHKTVAENIGFPLKMAKRPKAEIDEKVTRAAKILDLAHLLDRFPKQLSGGQRQRVAMGRAIVRDPQVFLFDEPLSNLDAKLRVTMRVEIKELHQRLKTTIVYVTHDQIEAMTMADKIVVMRDGRVEQIGAPLDLYDRPGNVFVAGFIGSPSMNFLRGKIASADGAKQFASDSGLRLPLPDTGAPDGAEVIYGIRPEHIGVSADGTAGGVPVNVVVVEPTGSETQIFAKAGGDVIDAIVKDRIRAAPGSQIHFVIDPANVHLFDAKTEQRI